MDDATVLALAKMAADVIDNPAAAIDIRDGAGRYLYVNTAWEQAYKLTQTQVAGKGLHELGMVPLSEAANVSAEDETIKSRGSHVKIDTYEIFGVPTTILFIRVWLVYHGEGAMIDMSMPSDPASSADFEHALGELAGWRLRIRAQFLDD